MKKQLVSLTLLIGLTIGCIGCAEKDQALVDTNSTTHASESLPEVHVPKVDNVDSAIMSLTNQEVEDYYPILCELSTYPSVNDIKNLDIPFQEKIDIINAINEAPDVIRYLGLQSNRQHLGESAANSPHPQVPDRCFENGREPVSLEPTTLPEDNQ